MAKDSPIRYVPAAPKRNGERQHEGILFAGAPGFGKSVTQRRMLDKYKGNVLVYKAGENLNDAAFAGWPIMDLKHYKGGKAIIDGDRIGYTEFMALAFKYYRDGALVVDDAGLYERDDISDVLKNILINRRRLRMDVVLTFHGMADIPIRIFQYMNWIYLFHTIDNPAYKLRKIPRGTDVMAAQEMIAREVAKGNRFYSLSIRIA